MWRMRWYYEVLMQVDGRVMSEGRYIGDGRDKSAPTNGWMLR